MLASLNVLGTPLSPCSTDPMTGWFRDGCCNTDTDDKASHTVCCQVTLEFLEFLQLFRDRCAAYSERICEFLSRVKVPVGKQRQYIGFWHRVVPANVPCNHNKLGTDLGTGCARHSCVHSPLDGLFPECSACLFTPPENCAT